MLIEKKGTIVRIRFRNDVNGYTVAVLRTDEDEELTVVGNMSCTEIAVA